MRFRSISASLVQKYVDISELPSLFSKDKPATLHRVHPTVLISLFYKQTRFGTSIRTIDFGAFIDIGNGHFGI